MHSHVHAAAAVLLSLALAGSAVIEASAAGPAKPSPPKLSSVAPTPPMGWNSWDAYGFTIDEAQFKANASVLATVKAKGWSYAVIDEGWYMADPLAATLSARHYLLDGGGRLQPVVARFPSAADGHGLKGLADWTHAQGLKFGIHIVRGIPKAAVAQDLQIAGSAFRAPAAADRDATCPWDDGNWGVADNAAGQAYYDSLIGQYAAWGVDFLKVDCISDHPYRPSEIRQIDLAIRKAGRPMVLSLSPGPARLENTAEMASHAQMWRIADDLWDGWTLPHASPNSEFPNGVLSAFTNLAKWNPVTGPERWPDADMLPFGSLHPHPGWGDPRQSRLTVEEARTAMSLWAIARSPLILGGNLTEMDGDERALLDNGEIIALNQRDGTSHPVTQTTLEANAVQVWVSTPTRDVEPDTVAVFNLTDAAMDISTPWTNLGLPAGVISAHNLWSGARLPASDTARFTIPAHGSAVLRVAGAKP